MSDIPTEGISRAECKSLDSRHQLEIWQRQKSKLICWRQKNRWMNGFDQESNAFLVWVSLKIVSTHKNSSRKRESIVIYFSNCCNISNTEWAWRPTMITHFRPSELTTRTIISKRKTVRAFGRSTAAEAALRAAWLRGPVTTRGRCCLLLLRERPAGTYIYSAESSL